MSGSPATPNQIRALRILTAEIKDENEAFTWMPRVGIGTEAPREMLQIGERLTFHSQGADVIGHNIYYDTEDRKSKRIGNHPASAIGFYDGIITIGTVGLGAANSDVDFANWSDNTLQGMTILPIYGNAHVGIGVTYPGARLDVRGVTNNGSSSAFRVMNSDQTTLFQIFDHGAVSIGAPASASPTKMLQVAGDAQMGTITSTALVGVIGSAARPVYADANGTLTTSGSPAGWALTGNSGISSPSNFIGTTDGQPLDFRTNNQLRMKINSGGQVEIGKAYAGSGHTDFLLAVSGKIICNDLRVIPLAGNWPDYVFSENHTLMSLDEVEKSVKEHRHLPGMPSAREVETNGIDVGEMQRKLLEKMEEMTLYMIELKKENVELRAKIENLTSTSATNR